MRRCAAASASWSAVRGRTTWRRIATLSAMSMPRIYGCASSPILPNSPTPRPISSRISITRTIWPSLRPTKEAARCSASCGCAMKLDEETAEYAILVRSRLKGHGLGYLLMQRVIQYAKDKNLRRIYGDVLVENTMMLQMASELGFHIEDIGSGLKRVVLNWRPASGAAARS